MNKKNVKKVRDLIACVTEKEPHRFNMAAFVGELVVEDGERFFDGDTHNERTISEGLKHNCNSCACIAGWASSLTEMGKDEDIEEAAARYMGLGYREAHDLFYPYGLDHSWEAHTGWGHVRPEQAIKVLDHLLETGKVDWKIIGEYTPRPKEELIVGI